MAGIRHICRVGLLREWPLADKQTGKQTEQHADKPTDRQWNRKRQTARQTDKPTNRMTPTHTSLRPQPDMHTSSHLNMQATKHTDRQPDEQADIQTQSIKENLPVRELRHSLKDILSSYTASTENDRRNLVKYLHLFYRLLRLIYA